MRVKTDSRRQAILDAALTVFKDVGYDRASMAQISALVGGSKATLYSYFPSKEDLFAEAMIDAVEDQGQALLDLLDPDDPDIAKVLTQFGEGFLAFTSGAQDLCITRTAIAEGGKSALGAKLYQLGPKRGRGAITDYFAKVMANGRLRPGDPYMAAIHLQGMLATGVTYPMLFGAEPDLEPKAAVAGAVAAFLRAYG
jgi:AcrR family transcriptional regulator